MSNLMHIPILFGQAFAETSVRSEPSWLMISLLAVAVISLLVVVPTVLGLRHARTVREMEHAERMRALELGHPAPRDEESVTQSPGMAIGLWVPIAVFGIAFVASKSGYRQEAAWIAAAIVGTASVICGTILTMTAGQRAASAAGPQGKPVIDRAAYEELAERQHSR